MTGLKTIGANVLPARVIEDAFRDEYGKATSARSVSNFDLIGPDRRLQQWLEAHLRHLATFKKLIAVYSRARALWTKQRIHMTTDDL